MKQTQNIDWELAARVYSGEASEAEKKQFAYWAESAEHKAEWEEITNKLGQVDLALVNEKVDINKAWQQVKSQTTGKNKGVYRMLKTGYLAAAASIIIAVVLFLTPHDIATNNSLLQARTTQSIEVIDLQDGSKVDLNRNSSIAYPETFDESQRLVELKGEAFFDVASDRNRPFIIDAGELHIKVVGTSFNVKAYPSSHLKTVNVKSGLVEVSSQIRNQKIILLKAGDKVVLNTLDNSLVKLQDSNNNYMAWKTKEISFENEDLNKAIKLLEEVYDVSIQAPDSFDLSNAKIDVTFHKNNIDFIIDVIEKTYAIDLIVTKN